MGERRATTLFGNPEVADDARFVTALARGEVLLASRPQDCWLTHDELVLRTQLPRATVLRPGS